jgi:hypothetical protein
VSDLLNRISAAQREAGERVVMDDLRERGLLDIVKPTKEPNCFADYCEMRGISYEGAAHDSARWFYYRGILDAQKGILRDLQESITFVERSKSATEVTSG